MSTGDVEKIVENYFGCGKNEQWKTFPTFPQSYFFNSLWKCGKLCLIILNKYCYKFHQLFTLVEKNLLFLYKQVLINCKDYL